MSLYSTYLLERTHDNIIEREHGFATYRYVNDGKSVYIIDIFVTKEERKSGAASALADLIAYEARQKGCTEMIGTVVPSMKGATASVRVLLAYGFDVHSASNDVIIFRKDL